MAITSLRNLSADYITDVVDQLLILQEPACHHLVILLVSCNEITKVNVAYVIH